MKANINSFGARVVLFILAATTLLASANTARASTILEFSGGNGAPLVLTLTTQITYVIDTTASSAPFFVFQGVGDPLSGARNVSGTITYSIDGLASRPITRENSGLTSHDIFANDFYMFGALPGVTSGNVITLSPGTLTTIDNIAAAPPAGGEFSTFIMDGFGNRISPFGIAAPEPSTFVLAGLGVLGLGIVARRKKDRRN